MHNSLDGKVAIVTGASSGIGRAISRDLADLGCRLVLSGRNQDRLDALAAEIGAAAVTAPQDLSNRDEVTTPLDVAQRAFGKLDILVLNAGLFSNAPLSLIHISEPTRLLRRSRMPSSA